VKFLKLDLAPAQIVIISFATLILIGTLLLLLPAATVSGKISLIDALFTATSATCVTKRWVLSSYIFPSQNR